MDGLALVIGVLAAVAVVWWLAKKLFTLAALAALVGVAAWFWYLR